MSRLPTAPWQRRALELALFTAIAAGLFVRLGGDRVYPKSEARCIDVVGEMVRSGDWLVPRLNRATRLQKPPLYYWAAATVGELAGGSSPWTVRSVSAAAALVLAGAVFAVGRSLGGWPAGFCSAAALAAMALFWVRGRIGDAEMLLALLVFLALAAFERLWFRGDRRMAPLLALLVGLGFLTKATAALVSVGAPILVWLILQRSLRLAVHPRALAWSAAAAALGLSWYVAILLRVPAAGAEFRAFLMSPFGVHAHADATHVRSLLYYLPRLPLQTLPAGLLFLPLGWEGWRERLWRADPRLHFYAVAFVAQLAAWSLVPGKQLHNVLGLLPLFAVVAGRRISERLSLGLGPEPDDPLAALDPARVALDHPARVRVELEHLHVDPARGEVDPRGRVVGLAQELGRDDHRDHHLGDRARGRAARSRSRCISARATTPRSARCPPHARGERREHRLHAAPTSSLRSSSKTKASAPLPISFSAKETWISDVPS